MTAAKSRLGGWILVAAVGLNGAAGQAAETGPAGEVVRLPAIADVWLSDATPRERDSNSGKYGRLKLKNIQEMALVRFDASAAKGRTVLAASLFLRRAGADKLRYIRVSTVNQDWAEGNGRMPYGPPSGATFLHADGTPNVRRPWAWPGSSLADVIMSSGHSLGCWAERKKLPGGWISLPLAPELVYAMAVGDTDGLAIMDGGNPANENNLVYSAQAAGSEPYILARLGEPLEDIPAVPIVKAKPAPERADLGRGAVQLVIEPAPNVFCWRLTLDGEPLPRWQVKHPARRGATTLHLEDMPAGEHRLEVVAIAPGGASSPPARLAVTGSPARTNTLTLGKFDPPQSGAAAPVEDGTLRVWALPGLVKISPTQPEVMFADLGTGNEDSPPNSTSNPVWDGNEIKLFGARGEYVSCQLCLENLGKEPLRSIRVRPGALAGPNGSTIEPTEIELFLNWYARNAKQQWQPAYCVPIEHGTPLSIPDPLRGLADQQNQTLYVDVYIPKDAEAGEYAGSVAIEAGGGRKLALPVKLRVFDFLLPDRLSFWPELNAYGIPKQAHYYYRLAHRHRCVLNCLGWTPKLEGSGKGIRVVWADYDLKAGPLLSGEAFSGSRRDGVPVECMYLPLGDSWPTPLTKETYNYQAQWPGKGDPIDGIVEHYLTAPYIGSALSREYREAFLAVQRQFIEHFRERNYTQTEMQCFFGSKATHRINYGSNVWWTTDEPYHWDDWLALQFFLHLWSSGRGTAEGRLWAARADISRPQWQGRVLNGIVDAAYFGAGGFNTPAMVRRCRTLARESGLKLRSYGTVSRDDAGNTQTVATLLDAWSNGADAFLPWQTLGTANSLDRNDAGANGGAALLVPGDRFGWEVVGDFRLKALRDGQQLIEYLTLLAKRRQLTREQIRAVIRDAVGLEARARDGAGVDDADAVRFSSLSAWQIAELRRRVAERIVE